MNAIGWTVLSALLVFWGAVLLGVAAGMWVLGGYVGLGAAEKAAAAPGASLVALMALAWSAKARRGG